ncbi:hypothetical protein R3W88_008920 [Solanum pinnatisectum]|uniref:Uncharacterized protein n=1 Tax=Solanum pinnatisectum TaxID=50273 RepID=A0AAV9MCH7_9SOLN|nr:hypothetical protein R3W88_008920 [Solanum pinnatisectum]
MEVITRASIKMVAIISFLLATISPSTMAYDNVSPSLAPVPTSDGTKIDQGIAYGLMLVALVLTYLIH